MGPAQQLAEGDWVVVRRQRTEQFSFGAVGPYRVARQQGDRVLVRGWNGKEHWENQANCKKLKGQHEL